MFQSKLGCGMKFDGERNWRILIRSKNVQALWILGHAQFSYVLRGKLLPIKGLKVSNEYVQIWAEVLFDVFSVVLCCAK